MTATPNDRPSPEISAENDDRQIEEALNQAIMAHIAWKQRLRQAVELGQSDASSVKALASKDRCSVGNWLYNDPHAREHDHYAAVERLHAKFHQSASEVLWLALNHRGDEAERLMNSRSSFTVTSERLLEELERWKASLHR